MIVIVALAAIFLLLKWITRRYYSIPERYKVDMSKLTDTEKDRKNYKEGLEHLRRRTIEEESNEKPKDFFDEVDEMIAAKKIIRPPSRPKSKYEGALFLSQWQDYENQLKASQCNQKKRKRKLDKETIEEIKEGIRKCKY